MKNIMIGCLIIGLAGTVQASANQPQYENDCGPNCEHRRAEARERQRQMEHYRQQQHERREHGEMPLPPPLPRHY